MEETVRVTEVSTAELDKALDGIGKLFAGELTDEVRSVLKHYASDGEHALLVARPGEAASPSSDTASRSGETLAGFLSGYFPVTMDYEGRVGRIDVLLVHRDWRKRGVGRTLLDEFRNRARARGCRHLLADVPIREGREAAVSFWTAAGFHETDIRQFWAET
jgi:ribosomal protein S18 acetylase RimI-like enzyme